MWNVYLKATSELLGQVEYDGEIAAGAKRLAAHIFKRKFSELKVTKV